MIHVFARAEIKPECLDAYVEILKDIVPKVRQEPGCVYYAPCFDWRKPGDDSGKVYVTMVESWKDKASLDAHGTGPVLAEFKRRFEGMRGSAEGWVLQSIID